MNPIDITRRRRCWPASPRALHAPPLAQEAAAAGAPGLAHGALSSRAASSSRWRGRRRRVAPDRAPGPRLDAAPRPLRAPRAAAADAARLEPAGAGHGPALDSAARHARALPLRARCAARRRDGVLRHRRRRRRPALRFLRRVPAADPRHPALAHRPHREPATAERRAPEDPHQLRARSTTGCSSRATCSTCRRAGARRHRRRASA